MPTKLNLQGKRFLRLICTEAVGSKHGSVVWKCICDCGNETFVTASALKSGNTKSCGCLQRELSSKRQSAVVSIGDRFGRWSIVGESSRDGKTGARKFLCKCECGNIKIVAYQPLAKGESKSCGCLALEMLLKTHRTHGKSNTRIYKIWGAMKARCHNDNLPWFKNYGGRGIKVCEQWANSFELFFEWSMANGYKPNLTIERNNNDGDYCPENCSWILKKDQLKNKRNNRFIEYNGKRMILEDWAKHLGIKSNSLIYRLRKLPLDIAMTKGRLPNANQHAGVWQHR